MPSISFVSVSGLGLNPVGYEENKRDLLFFQLF